jgi:hypothetical protein
MRRIAAGLLSVPTQIGWLHGVEMVAAEDSRGHVDPSR